MQGKHTEADIVENGFVCTKIYDMQPVFKIFSLTAHDFLPKHQVPSTSIISHSLEAF